MIPRRAIAAISVSAAALVGIALQEGYTDRAVIPVPGDVPTKGFGTTRGVKLGDTTTPTRALVDLLDDADEVATAVRRCVPVPMHQHEFDAYVSLAYNIGPGAFCGSTLARKLNAGDYPGACSEILRWRHFQGRDCATVENRCGGLWTRRQAEYQQCLGPIRPAAPASDRGANDAHAAGAVQGAP